MADYENVYSFERALGSAIRKFMSKNVANRTETALLERIESEVYSYPESLVYHRRHQLDNRKNIDKEYVQTSSNDSLDGELTVQTVATGTFNHRGVRLDAMVESGSGVDWGGNAVYQRPFYRYADADIQKFLDQIDGYLEGILNI